MDKFAVIGNPIAHSLSPLIFQHFSRLMGQPLSYEKIAVEAEQFIALIAQLQNQGYKAVNITTPYKLMAFNLAQSANTAANATQSANGLTFLEDGTIFATNTDGIGLVSDISRILSTNFSGKRILIIGAGGAAQGCLPSLLAANPAEILIINRTISKAQDLATRYQDLGIIKAISFDQLTEPLDIIINASAASLHGDLPPLPAACLAEQTLCYDMMYSQEPTPFLNWAQQFTPHTADGLGMLLEQAKENYYRCYGERPALSLVELRKILGWD